MLADLGYRGKVLEGNDEEVDRRLRGDVGDHEDDAVVVQLLAGNLTRRDLAEDAVVRHDVPCRAAGNYSRR